MKKRQILQKKTKKEKKNHNSLNKSPENCDFFRLIFIGTAEIYLKQTFFFAERMLQPSLIGLPFYIFMRPRQKARHSKKQFTPPPLRAALGGTGGSVNCFLARRAF